MDKVSACCSAEIVTKHHKESPLNDGFHISYSAPACSNCWEEHPEELNRCDCCGEGFENLITVKLGYWCQSCCEFYAEELMERK
jgi:hypothetical protein